MDNAKAMKQMLAKQYKYRIEMHAHTCPISKCSDISPEELVDIYHEKGYDAIVITNHFIYEQLEGMSKDDALDLYISDYEKAKKAAEKYNIKVFLGAELRFSENHNDYLLYGVNRDILSKAYDYLPKGVEAFRKDVSLPESVFLQAHPFRKGMELCAPEILDGIETFNMHPNHNSRVAFAVKYAAENKKAITTAGSDFHHLGHEAVSAMRTSLMPQNSFDIAKILKSGDYIFEVGENALILP